MVRFGNKSVQMKMKMSKVAESAQRAGGGRERMGAETASEKTNS